MRFYRRGVFGCPNNLSRLASVPDTDCQRPRVTWLYNLLVAWHRDPAFPQNGWHYYLFFFGTIPISVNVPDIRVTNGLASATSRVDRRLRELQRGSYSHIVAGLTQAGNLEFAAKQLSGAKKLVEVMIILGFPQSLESDDFVRALLIGDERLLDTSAITNLCNLGIERSYDTNQNAKVDIAAILDERVAALETWVSNRLSQIQTTGQGESLRLVSSTLRRLEAFRSGWRFPSPPPYINPLGHQVTNGIPKRLFVTYGEPNIRYTVQFSANLSQWTDLPARADEGQSYITTLNGQRILSCGLASVSDKGAGLPYAALWELIT